MRTKIIILPLLFIILGTFGFYVNNQINLKTSTQLTLSKDSYEKQWKKVDSLINKGLTKSAQEIVAQIYLKAKQESNAPQLVKSVLYKTKLNSDYEEESFETSIKFLKDELQSSKPPLKQIYHSIIAEFYWFYYQNNRYLFANRTETVNFEQDDIKTWDLTRLLKTIVYHFNKSLENASNTKNVAVRNYEPILSKVKNSEDYRPTLYDFLAHRAIDFFMNDESRITEPIYKFELNNKVLFATSSEFSNYRFTTADSLSLTFYAVQIFQQLIAFHLNDAKPDALIDVELKRLKFMKDNAIVQEKDSLYLKAFLLLEKKYLSFPASTDITYEIATLYSNSGAKYNPLKPEQNKWDRKKSYNICKDAINRFPSTNGALNCKCLQQTLATKTIAITTEYANMPEKPFLALLKYKNLSKMYFRILEISPEKNRDLTYKLYGKKLIDAYKKLNIIKKWDVSFEDDGDLNEHSVEIMLPKTDKGFYILLASTDSSFSYKKGEIEYLPFWVTDISYISRSTNDGSLEFTVLNRTNGKPLPNINITTYTNTYNYILQKYELLKSSHYTTNSEGYFKISAREGANNYQSIVVEFEGAKDKFITDNYFYIYKRNIDKQKTLNTYFFTDRSIYRPSQTVYFKALLTETYNEKTTLLKNTKTTVTFYDPNWQKISSLDLVSNEYGSVNGTFTAPSGTLTGSMSITNGSGTVYVSVEEYKRPKFEATFKPIKDSYRLNDKVKITGEAKAYAGNAIDQAKVKYTVTRTAQYPYKYYWSWWMPPSSPQLVITYGETVTDENGNFKIEFDAVADLSIDKAYKPVFYYEVKADVTDINGETHSAKTTVGAGYNAMIAGIDFPEDIIMNSKSKFKIFAKNLNQQEVPAQGTIKVYKLKTPVRVMRSKVWSQPDRHIMSKTEYEQNFPFDVYADENNIMNLEREKLADSISFVLPADTFYVLKKTKYTQGIYYYILNTKDIYGEKVESVGTFKVFDEKEITTADNLPFNLITINAYGQPGDKASFILSSAYENLSVLVEVEHKDNIVEKFRINLNKEQKLIEFPIKEEHRGNFCIHFTAVMNNRSYAENKVVVVPHSDKNLNIEFSTFRNKLLPGAKEEWNITIKDFYGLKAAAEMLATLYDASLDAFKLHYWNLMIYGYNYAELNWQSNYAFTNHSSNSYTELNYNNCQYIERYYDALNWYGLNYGSYYNYGYGGGYRNQRMLYKTAVSAKGNRNLEESEDGILLADEVAGDKKVDDITTIATGMNKKAPSPPSAGEKVLEAQSPKPSDGLNDVALRSNFNETAFFYPTLKTNDSGNIVISFTLPESLTKWKMLGFAHTADLKYGFVEKELITQKDLMVVPNAPRFLREDDTIIFTAKVSNISEKDLSGETRLLWFDATTMKPIDQLMFNTESVKAFTAKAGQSTLLKWKIIVPNGIGAVTYRIVAKAGNFSDGEEKSIPVLSNRILVTESLPLPINGNETKKYSFKKLLESKSSSTIKNFKLTLEFTSNPAWYAVQALPYLIEYPYECSEQTFSRYYANTIASFIVNSNPKIKNIFEQWKNSSPDAFLSNLEKNQELKSVVIEETPWLLQAQNETERKKRIALLFDLNRMSNERDATLKKLKKKQTSNGGWAWFSGGPDDRYITQYIVTGFAHLKQLAVSNPKDDNTTWQMLKDAVLYLDKEIRKDYENIKKWNKNYLNENHISSSQIQYLYARSFFKNEIEINSSNKEAFGYFKTQSKKYWLQNNKYLQAMIAIAMHRFEEKTTAQDILKSLKENALYSDEMGMYWRDNNAGYFWYQAPIEFQAMMIEAFTEVTTDLVSVEKQKIWLLKQKQTQDWGNTRATAEACYALLLRGFDLLASDQLVEVKLGDLLIDPTKLDNLKVEAGTGYYKTSWSGSDIKPEMGNVTATKKDNGVAWGALYYQYFENVDKITAAKTNLQIDKKLFVERNTPTGAVIEPINAKTILKIGDKVKVRIEIRVDRDMEYVHLKDMRASAFEPVNVISQYKYQGGIGYYESTRDAATNFFISYLAKGTYVFEYPMFVTHSGNFSNGITTIQCMYAPEFTSHSEGIRVKIVE